MIMARNEDGTYSQVGFIKDNNGVDTEYIYDKDGDKVFEKGFTREINGAVPLTINGIGKNLKDWGITGNTVQNGTPTPENPVEVQSVGDYDSETGMYKIPVVTKSDGAEPITTPIYIPTPLYSGEVLRSDGSRDVKWGKIVLTGEEEITTHKPFADGTVSIRIPSSKAKPNGIIYCTHLQNVSFPELYNHEKQGISTHLKNELNNLYCLIRGFTTLKQYKDFFSTKYAAGTPVTVWYQLAEPTTETFTAPQIPTLNGTTVIDVDTVVKPTEMHTKYKSSK